jgi:hypothetical protein
MMVNSPGGISQDLDAAPGVQFAMNFLSGGRDDYWSRQPVTVDARDESSVTVVMHHTGIMRGRVIKELAQSMPVPEVPNVGIQLDPADGTPALGSPGISLDPRIPADDFAIGGLFNSLLIDHTESIFFAWATASATLSVLLLLIPTNCTPLAA